MIDRLRSCAAYVSLFVAATAAPSFSALATPSVPGAVKPDALRTQAIFDEASIAAARAEVEATLAEAESAERRALLRSQLDELARARRLLEQRDVPPAEDSGEPPFSLRDLDRTLERRESALERQATLENAVRSAEGAFERTQRVLDDVRGRFASGSATSEDVALAKERVRLARFQLRNARTELAMATSRAEALTAAAEQKRQRLQVTEDDLTARVASIEGQRERLEDERRRVQSQLDGALKALETAVQRGRPEARLRAMRAEVALLERRVELLDAHRGDLAMALEGWELRYRLASGELDTASDENRAERRLEANLSELVHERDLMIAERERLRAEIQSVEAERAAAEESDDLRWIDARLATLTQRLEVEGDYAASLERLIAASRRNIAAFRADDVAENVQEGVSAVGETIRRAWSFELTTVDDRSITVGKVIIALVLIVAGIFVSRLMAGQLRRRVFDRMSMDASLAASLQTLTLYLLVLLFFLTALRFVSIPLTALTFIGGALAIGVGFGSQNIVNNFISGLILMAERPIKVGDMIEVGGTYGRVERIGGRSTRVRSGNNTHIIVPNSTFLEKEVLNWTLSDTTIRTHVDVGVAYGSPTREVEELLARSVAGHEDVLERPVPEVLFMNFGDNALEFRVYFWIQVRQILDRLRIQSDVRFRIDELFSQAGITIAFPQRDVHLDAADPLRVRLLPEDRGEEPPPGA